MLVLLVEMAWGYVYSSSFCISCIYLFAWLKMVALDKINTITLDTNNRPLRKTIMGTIKGKTITPLVIKDTLRIAPADPLDTMTARRRPLTVTTVDARTVMTTHRLVVKNHKVK